MLVSALMRRAVTVSEDGRWPFPLSATSAIDFPAAFLLVETDICA
jgi:hypothetical protein